MKNQVGTINLAHQEQVTCRFQLHLAQQSKCYRVKAMKCEAFQEHDEQIVCSGMGATAGSESPSMKNSSHQILFRLKSPIFLEPCFIFSLAPSHDGTLQSHKNIVVHMTPGPWPLQGTQYASHGFCPNQNIVMQIH